MSAHETDGISATDTSRREYVKPRLQEVPMQQAMGAAGFTPSSGTS